MCNYFFYFLICLAIALGNILYWCAYVEYILALKVATFCHAVIFAENITCFLIIIKCICYLFLGPQIELSLFAFRVGILRRIKTTFCMSHFAYDKIQSFSYDVELSFIFCYLI